MKITKLYLRNFGPISNVTIEPRFSDDGHPIPIAIVGQNGAGKSLALSVILDAMTEARRSSFSEIQEIEANQFLKNSSQNYVQHASAYSHTSVTISVGDGEIVFNEVVSRIPPSEFLTKNLIPSLLTVLQGSEFANSGFFKNISVGEHQKVHIRGSEFLYFPYFRYESPYWMNETAKVNFVKDQNHYGKSKLNPIRTNIIEETKRWILNVLLDRELYEKKIETPIYGTSSYPYFQGYAGPNTQLFSLVNEIVSTMLIAKNSQISSARIGIGPKGNREITVFATKKGKQEEIVAPDISQMSSGELMTLGLATEIIRAYEIVKGAPPQSLNDVTGIVLVDEIDLHLHVSFQKEVLPKIIRKFPNVQFIFSTHSPFFLLGMADSGELDIYNFPIGCKIAPHEFDEFQSSYDLFISENDQFRKRYEELKNMSQSETKPLIITEGKTDWKHLKFALKTLASRGQFESIDIDFFEYENEVNMGDTRLSQMCEHMATLPQKRKMIFVFDRDNPTITKSMSGAPNAFKDWGNNVYSVCLPIPKHRSEYKNLSIELYYTDDTLRTVDPASGKRLWFSNEIEIITRPTTGQRIYRAQDFPNVDDELAKKVFDQPADQIVDGDGNTVGLSKSAFTEVITNTPYETNAIDLTAFAVFFEVIKNLCDISAAT
ncbi:AAA family ATPase [Undibacterium amnicola]|uniref:AAA family ATPase n=1 Tax=Undibacterium amnicola TaxID=1834038 RepID=A0ABR6XV01_9BURK|nr:AAA family ATPase [Undibacterium amnicola]MBC3832762.1 AAA family ATPase [Undibacterium amnicola]